jgi:kynurenine formamidase
MRRASSPDLTDIDELVTSVSNWGRWGSDDVLGTLNLIGVEGVKAYARAITLGESFSLARELKPRATPDNPRPMLHHMLRTGLEASVEGFSSSDDWFGFSFHGFGVTHLDALSHVFWKGRMYNGGWARDGVTLGGSLDHSVVNLAGGALTRGVLFDVPRLLGVPWMNPGDGVTVADLLGCEEVSGTRVGAGDAVVVRTGRDARAAQHGVHEPLGEGNPGLLPECARWLRERDVGLLATDVAADVMVPGGAPHTMPIHAACLVGMGMPMVDNALLERLADRCAELGRTDFGLAVMPLVLGRGTGSPVNPVAVL